MAPSRHTEAMTRNTATTPRRLGRPRDSNSADTRERILVAARTAFALNGYEVATNRSLATAAGITSGALYHYFESKLHVYVEIYRDVQTLISQRFEEAIADEPTFVGRLHAVLDASHDLNLEDPTLAQFLGAVRIDRHRHPEIDEAIRAIAVGAGFFRELVAFGTQTGEIPSERRRLVLAYLETVLTGLTDAVSGDDDRHSLAVESLKLSIGGGLFDPPNGAARRGDRSVRPLRARPRPRLR